MKPVLPFDIASIRRDWISRRIGNEIRLLNSTGSTNDQIKQRIIGGAAEGLVVVAESQTQGRGRLGRHWHSPPGLGLYLSVLLRPPVPVFRYPRLTLMAGVALASALEGFSKTPPRLKWPNDVLIGGRKVCGILAEFCAGPGPAGVVLGIGVNVNHAEQDFPPELRATAASLRMLDAASATVDRNALLHSILRRLDAEYAEFIARDAATDNSLIEKWSEKTDLFGQTVTVTRGGQSWGGKATGLDDNGALIVETGPGQSRVFDSGEVTLAQKNA